MDQPSGYLETSLNEDGPFIVDAPGPRQQITHNSNFNYNGAANRTKTFRQRCKGRLKLSGWFYFLLIIGLIAVVTIAIACFSKQVESLEPVSGIIGKYAERFAAVSNSPIDPCKRFNTFACSKNATRTVDENKIMMIKASLQQSTLTATTETVLHVVRSLLEQPNSNYEPRAVKMAKQMYSDCMVNTSFSSYYEWDWIPFFNETDNDNTLERQLAQVFAHGDQSMFSLGVTDDQDSSTYLLTFSKGDPVQEILAATESEEVVKFEEDLKMLWEESACEENKGDIWSGRKNYRNFTLDFIQTQIPQIKWTRLVEDIFDILGLKGKVSSEMKVQFRCFNFFQGLGDLIEESESSTVSNYIVSRFANENVNYLDNLLFQSWLQTHHVHLEKKEEQLRHLRWKNCASIVKGGFGVALAHLYQQKDPKTKTKKIVGAMTRYLQMAFQRVVFSQAWIPAKGKDQFIKELIDKMMHMKIKIGYPDYIMNATLVDEYYEGLVLNESSFILNVLRMKKFLALKNFMLVDKKSDRAREPHRDPMVVGALNNIRRNEIVIPVGLLHFPMFDEDYPMYLNFANLGFVLAHEIVHGFDHEGLHYDKYGNFTSWMPDDFQKAFRDQAICFVEQYGKFELPQMDGFVDGNNTLGENICDNAAAPLSLLAYELWAKDHNNPQEQFLPGLNFTIPQMFYIALGQMYCEPESEGLSQFYTQNVHSPGKFRVLGVVENSQNFGNTFGCPVGSPMNPTHKCSLWS